MAMNMIHLNNLWRMAAVFAAIAVSSCTKSPLEPDQFGAQTVSEPVECSIIARCPETRTTNAGLSTLWGTKDALTVFYKSGDAYSCSRFIHRGENNFSGSVVDPNGLQGWIAVYPYDAANTEVGKVGVIMDKVPVQSGDDSMAHLAGPGFPLVGTMSEEVLDGTPVVEMNLAYSVGKFVVTNKLDGIVLNVKGFDFTAPGAITGSFAADLGASVPVWKPVREESSNTVSLRLSEDLRLAPGESITLYAGVMPFDYEGEFVMKVIAEADGTDVFCERTAMTRMTFDAARINTVKFSVKDLAPVAPQAQSYNLVTSAPKDGDWSGCYIVASRDSKKALAAFSSNSKHCVDINISGSSIASTPDVDKYSVEFVATGHNHANETSCEAYDVINSEGKYVFASSSSFQITDRPTKDGNYYRHYFKYDGGVMMVSSRDASGSTSYYLGYSEKKNANKNCFEYSSSTKSLLNLYKLDHALSRQIISFAEPEIVWMSSETADHQLGCTFRMPQEVSGAHTAVCYSSSDNSVAEVLANNWVRINGYGSVTITAKAEGDGTYKPASASYSLRIREYKDGSLGYFNLESEWVEKYLTAAEDAYTDSNWSSVSVVSSYANGRGGVGYDVPRPVTLSWEGFEDMQKVVTVYNDAQMQDAEQSVTTASSSVDIYNLIPGRDYWYTVVTSYGNLAATGFFTTEGRRRLIRVSDTVNAYRANNCRDLGGLEVGDGRHLKYGLAFRGSNMNNTTEAEQKLITGYMNVRMDIDLRLSDGVQVLDGNLVGYSHAGFSSFTDLSNPAKIKTTFDDIIKTVTSGDAVYIHCYAGADRTGYICMLLEAVCGVSQKDCSIDYELTSFSCLGLRDRVGDHGDYYFTKGMTYIEGYRGNTFQEKATNILLDADISADQISALRDAMIE